MGFEAPVGLVRMLHFLGAGGFAVLATWLAPNRRRVALAWLGAVVVLTLLALLPLRGAIAEAGLGFGIAVAALFGVPFALGLSGALGIALLVAHWRPRLSFTAKAMLALLGYVGGYWLATVVLPMMRFYTVSSAAGAG
jgi:hypothetical protein